MPTQTLLHQSDNAICMDISLLQSASSYIVPYSRGQDPLAEWCFAHVADSFCNGDELFYPLPHQESASRPFLMELWKPIGTLQDSELTDKELDYFERDIISAFARYVETVPHRLARLVRLQYSPEILEGYNINAGLPPIARVSRQAARLRENNEIPKLVAALRKQIHGEVPRIFQASREFKGNATHLAVSFLLSGFARGLSYADRCGRTHADLPYRPIWYRVPVTKLPAAAQTPRKVDRTGINWGVILSCIFSQDSPIEKRTRTRVERVMSRIREQVQAGKVNLNVPLASLRKHSGRISDLEALVLDTLRVSGVEFKYAGSRTEKLLKALLIVLAPIGLSQSESRLPVSLVVSSSTALITLASSYPNTELAFRLRFSRDTVWDVFEEKPRLTAAIKKAVARWQDA